MRIFLLPLTTRQALVYCQRAAPKPDAKRSILDRVSTKAVDTWAKWERAEKGWQKKVVTYGNKALQRIPYQEWGLKSFPASNPDLQAQQVVEGAKFEVVYPANTMKAEDVPKVLQRLAQERKSLHFNRFIGSLVGLPFTIPFALIPVIPNIPFFYVAYRAWSHWRALKGSDHLDFLIDHRLFRPVSNRTMEALYSRVSLHPSRQFEFVTRSQVEEGEVEKEQILMPSGAHNEVAKVLQVPELSGEVERAVWQVEDAARKQEAELTRQAKMTSQQREVAEKSEKEK